MMGLIGISSEPKRPTYEPDLLRNRQALGGRAGESDSGGRYAMIAPRALALAGTHRPEDIHEGVACGRFQEWANDETVVITEILTTPLRKTLNFFLAEGDMVSLRSMVPNILDWARMHGCTHAALTGRLGWSRVAWLKESGWTEEGVVMGRSL